MANLQSSGAISIANIKNLFGGPASPSMANYYRGGSYIPSTKTVSSIVYEPPNGSTFYGVTPKLTNGYYWIGGLYQAVWFSFNTRSLWWNGSNLMSNIADATTSVTIGAYTYYKGTDLAYSTYNTSCYCYQNGWYVRRTSGGSSTVSINTGIPASGQISMNQFYGAEKP
jgi:hypothetical protein